MSAAPRVSSLRAGVIGVGTMGLGVAQSLCRAGVATVVRDVRPDAERAAATFGAAVAASPAALARAADVIIVLVVDAQQVEDVLFGADGVAACGVPERIVALSSTVDPDFVVDVARRLAMQGVTLVDAPVSGGPARAHEGSLTVMAGGPPSALARCRPLLDCIGRRVFEVGAAGDGARMKLVNNLLAAVHLAAAAEALALAQRAGLDARLAGEVIGASSGGSWIVEDRLPRALARDLRPPRAAARILAKDVGLAAAYARRCGVATPFTDEARRAFETTLAAGLGEEDDAVLLAAVLGKSAEA